MASLSPFKHSFSVIKTILLAAENRGALSLGGGVKLLKTADIK
jgi:hypothetical protein